MLNVATEKFQIKGLEEFLIRENRYEKLSKPIEVPKEIYDKVIAVIPKEHLQYSIELAKNISEITGISLKNVKRVLRKYFSALRKGIRM